VHDLYWNMQHPTEPTELYVVREESKTKLRTVEGVRSVGAAEVEVTSEEIWDVVGRVRTNSNVRPPLNGTSFASQAACPRLAGHSCLKRSQAGPPRHFHAGVCPAHRSELQRTTWP
jgi:hypothetical protein